MKLGKQRWVVRSTIVAACAAWLYYWPLFHIIPLKQADKESAAKGASFEPVAFVEGFWEGQLLPGQTRAVDAADLIAAISKDRNAAQRTYGRKVGLSSAYFYFISGTGRVVEIDKHSIGLAISESATDAEVLLETGPIFGNAVRDATGLLDVNNFATSQDFNAVSSEINRRIEADVLPKLREQATVGKTVRFLGCVQIIDEDTDLLPLRAVPIVGEVL